MKKILLFSLICLMANAYVSAQCTPNKVYQDSTFGVYPRPYDPVVYPKGGIEKSACIGKPYKYILTAKVPDSITVTQFGFPLSLKMDSIKLDPKNPKTVQGLPVGMTFGCNPPSCVFGAKSLGCLYLYGTATSANAAGDYDLKLEMTAYVNSALGALSQKVTFPDATLAPGKYTLKLLPANGTTCFVSDAKDKNENIVHIGASPNPTNDLTTISFYALEQDKFDFVVTDMTGKIVYQENRSVEAGINSIDFDASNLSAGVYMYFLGNNKGKATNRLVVNR